MDLSFIYELKTASKELKMNLKKALATVYNICTPKANDDLNEFYRNFDESTCIRNLQGVAETLLRHGYEYYLTYNEQQLGGLDPNHPRSITYRDYLKHSTLLNRLGIGSDKIKRILKDINSNGNLFKHDGNESIEQAYVELSFNEIVVIFRNMIRRMNSLQVVNEKMLLHLSAVRKTNMTGKAYTAIEIRKGLLEENFAPDINPLWEFNRFSESDYEINRRQNIQDRSFAITGRDYLLDQYIHAEYTANDGQITRLVYGPIKHSDFELPLEGTVGSEYQIIDGRKYLCVSLQYNSDGSELCYEWYKSTGNEDIGYFPSVMPEETGSSLLITEALAGSKVWCRITCTVRPGCVTNETEIPGNILDGIPKDKPVRAIPSAALDKLPKQHPDPAPAEELVKAVPAAAQAKLPEKHPKPAPNERPKPRPLRADQVSAYADAPEKLHFFMADPEEIYAADTFEILSLWEYLRRYYKSQGFERVFTLDTKNSDDLPDRLGRLCSLVSDKNKKTAALLPLVLLTDSSLPDSSIELFIRTLRQLPAQNSVIAVTDDPELCFASADRAAVSRLARLEKDFGTGDYGEYLTRLKKAGRFLRANSVPHPDEIFRLLTRMRLSGGAIASLPFGTLSGLAVYIFKERRSGSGEWQFNSLKELKELLSGLTGEQLASLAELSKDCAEAFITDNSFSRISTKKSDVLRKLRKEIFFGREQCSFTDKGDMGSKCIFKTTVMINGKPNYGTAFVISPEGYALTCCHSVADKKRLTSHVMRGTASSDNGKETYSFSVVNVKSGVDLALIKIHKPSPMPFMQIADLDRVIDLHEQVTLAGYPVLKKTLVYPLSHVVSRKHPLNTDDPNEVYDLGPILNKEDGISGAPVISNDMTVIGIFRGIDRNDNAEMNFFQPMTSFIREFFKTNI
ncbi:MAG: trypsin-like peptidase domain-containing protein [Ruminococcus sp.]|nr:trypsin-like peptidase domain-containing protein [Ruminococcus sp.]